MPIPAMPGTNPRQIPGYTNPRAPMPGTPNPVNSAGGIRTMQPFRGSGGWMPSAPKPPSAPQLPAAPQPPTAQAPPPAPTGNTLQNQTAPPPQIASQSQFSTAGQPNITAQPIYQPDQIDAQVNSALSMNNASAQQGYQRAVEGLAGRGFGANSAQQAALKNRYDNQAMIANMQAKSQIPFQYAKDNATHLLNGQQAQEGQYASRQAEAIARMRDKTTQYGQTLGLLGSLF